VKIGYLHDEDALLELMRVVASVVRGRWGMMVRGIRRVERRRTSSVRRMMMMRRIRRVERRRRWVMPMSVEAWKPKERGRTRPWIVDSPGLVIIPVPLRPVIAPKEEGQTHVFVYRVSNHVTLDTRLPPNNNQHARKKTSREVQQKTSSRSYTKKRKKNYF
jgi:hypothetical protein